MITAPCDSDLGRLVDRLAAIRMLAAAEGAEAVALRVRRAAERLLAS